MNIDFRFDALLRPAVLALGLAAACANAQGSGEWMNPVIKQSGKVQPYPGSAAKPQPNHRYKVLFDITKDAEAADKVNPGLEHVARLVNLLALSGVPAKNRDIVAVVHGKATTAVLDDAHYREKRQASNPNLALIRELKENGVKLMVCGQALAHAELKPEWVDPEVTLALAALTVLPIYQHQGYALIPD